MALLPIPRGKNWKDTFGAQGASEATPSKYPDVVLEPMIQSGTYGEVVDSLVDGGGTTITVNWGDGHVEAVSPGAAINHTYDRNGDYGVQAHDTDYPSNRDVVHLRISEIPSEDDGPGGLLAPMLPTTTVQEDISSWPEQINGVVSMNIHIDDQDYDSVNDYDASKIDVVEALVVEIRMLPGVAYVEATDAYFRVVSDPGVTLSNFHLGYTDN